MATCEEKDRLIRAHSFATADYNRTLMLLEKRTGVMSKQNYNEIHEFAEKARKLLEQARAALDRHLNEHGC